MNLDIYYVINFIRKVQHNKPSKEKVFSYLKKLYKDGDKLVKDNFIEVNGDDYQESLFFLTSFMKSLVLTHSYPIVGGWGSISDFSKKSSRFQSISTVELM